MKLFVCHLNPSIRAEKEAKIGWDHQPGLTRERLQAGTSQFQGIEQINACLQVRAASFQDLVTAAVNVSGRGISQLEK